jgi:hypothetical protein
MFGRRRLRAFQEETCWLIVFAPHPFHAIYIHHINAILWPSPIPDGIAGVTKMQQYVKIFFPGIINAIEVVKELSRGTNSVFGVAAVNDLHAIPFFLLIRMTA